MPVIETKGAYNVSFDFFQQFIFFYQSKSPLCSPILIDGLSLFVGNAVFGPLKLVLIVWIYVRKIRMHFG